MATKDQRLLVFVAGPYSAPTREEQDRNVRKAVEVGRALFEKGYYPIVMHPIMREYLAGEKAEGPFGYEALLKYSFTVIERCDALLIYAPSRGADRECEYAKKLGKPVYRDIAELP